jgi:hypothetical protein
MVGREAVSFQRGCSVLPLGNGIVGQAVLLLCL